MRLRIHIHRGVVLCVLLVIAASLAAQPWQPLGPDGGTVRSLTFVPKHPDHRFPGPGAGRVYLSADNGSSWSRLVRRGRGGEMVLDHIVIDPANPRNIYVAAWNAQAPNSDGDLYRSKDGG